MNTTEQRIECDSGKLLARVCARGVKLWCAKHRKEEVIPWEELEALRRSMGEAQTPTASVGVCINRNLL